MDQKTYQQLEQVKINIETLLEEARNGVKATAQQLFSDDGWYDKFVWKVASDSDSYPNGITFLLVAKNELEFEAWQNERINSDVTTIFENAIRKLGMEWRCMNSNQLALLWKFANESTTTVFSKMVKEGKIVVENDEDLLKKIRQEIIQIEKEAEERGDSLRCLGDAINAVTPF